MNNRNCSVCGGLLTTTGNCTKCERERIEHKRIDDLRICRAELARLKEEKAEQDSKLVIYEQAFHNMTGRQAKVKASQLMALGVTYLSIESGKLGGDE